MKKLVLILTVLATMPFAHATSTIRTVASCTLEKPMMDNGLQVTVSEYTGPGTIGRAAFISAEVEQFFLGHTKKTSYDGLKETLPHAIGGGISYTGTDFSLELCTDCAPTADGKTPGTVTFEVDGQRNVEQVACTLDNN